MQRFNIYNNTYMGCGGSKRTKKAKAPPKIDKTDKSVPESQSQSQIAPNVVNSEPSILIPPQEPQAKAKEISKIPEHESQIKSEKEQIAPMYVAGAPKAADIHKIKEDLKKEAAGGQPKPAKKEPPKIEESKIKEEEIKTKQEDANVLRSPSSRLHKLKSPANDSEIFQNQSLHDFTPPSTYNKITWRREKQRANDLKSLPTTHFDVTVNAAIEKLTFNEFPISSATSKNIPKVVDCLAYIYKTPEDIEEIKKINTVFKYVWSQAVICLEVNITPELEKLEDETGIMIVDTMEDFMRNVYNDDRKLYVLLKDVFMNIDKDKSGFIDIGELSMASEQLGENPNPADIQNALREMDLNKDGKINFQEFVYWWKRGRQGAISIQRMAGDIASKFSANVPGSVDLLRKIGIGRRSIDKTTYMKEFTLRVGQEFQDPKLNLHFIIGKSAKREQILHEANQALSFNMRESWIAISLTTKNGNASSAHAELFLNTSKTILSSFLASAYDGNVLQNSIGVNAQSIGNKIFAGAWLDLNNEKFDSLHEKLDIFEKLFRSPVDDYFDLSLQFKNGLKNLENLTDAFRLKVTYVHWVKFIDMVIALTGKGQAITDLFPLSLLLMSGSMEMEYKSLNEIPNNPLSAVAPMAGPAINSSQQMIKDNINDMPYMSNVIREVIDSFSPKIEIICRFNNFGFKLEIEADGLNDFYQGIISG